MKKILLTLLICLMCFGCASMKLTSPMETNAVGFYLPKDGSVAGGVSHTVARLQHEDVKQVSLDLDGTLAQQVGKDKNETLPGMGIKGNFNVKDTDKGVNFIPSIGLTWLNNLKGASIPESIFKDTQLAIYGTILMYKW